MQKAHFVWEEKKDSEPWQKRFLWNRKGSNQFGQGPTTALDLKKHTDFSLTKAN